MAGYNRTVSVLQRKRNNRYDVVKPVEDSTTEHDSNSGFHVDGRVIVFESPWFSRRRKKSGGSLADLSGNNPTFT
jgi:hypothetical protein